jgi:hypothetical protein
VNVDLPYLVILQYARTKYIYFKQEMNSMNMFNQSQEMPEFSDMLTNWFSTGQKKKPVKTVAKKTPTGRRR